MGSRSSMPSSFTYARIAMIALHASVTDLYSAIAVDCAGTPRCKLHLKSTLSPFKKTKYPPRLRRVSGHDPWPQSTKTVAFIS